VIHAKAQRDSAGFERFENQVRVLGAGRGNFFQVLGIRRAFFFLLGNRDRHVATVFHFVTESFKARFETGYANRRRSHVDATAGLAKIERNSDDTNSASRNVGGERGCSRHGLDLIL
jgi:hypothetical protein